MRWLVAIPTYNEAKYARSVLSRVLEFAENVLIVDDGSTDCTPCILPEYPVEVIRHSTNRGYGRSMLDAFRWAQVDGFDWLITMDCDEQHEPDAIPRFVEAAKEGGADVISGSRYVAELQGNDRPPAERREVNRQITDELNERLGLSLTDAFCGFKAYRVAALKRLTLNEPGYAFPMQFWVQAVAHGLRIREIPVRLIYNDPNRTFGGPLNQTSTRLALYRKVLHCEIERCADLLPPAAKTRLAAGCTGT